MSSSCSCKTGVSKSAFISNMSQYLQAVSLVFICSLVGACHSCGNVTLNCTNVVSAVPCHELACLKMHWHNLPPYVYHTQRNSTMPYGILIDVTQTLLELCCGTCWQIRTTPPAENVKDFFESEPEDTGLSLPYITSVFDQQYGHDYVPIIKDPSSAFVKKKKGWKVLLRKLLSTIFNIWPVLLAALLLSCISGMIIWFLEMSFNHEQFPREFLRGSWEGVWWAVVSMTTVGYGDRTPCTFLGRVFAMLWIMAGICITSIFTATLTSALTMSKFDGQQTLAGIKVGVWADSLDAVTAIQNQADVVYYNSTDGLWNAVLEDKVDGILVDYYFAQVLKEENLMKDDLVITSIFKPEDWSIGILVRARYDLAECMRSEYGHDYARILYDATVRERLSQHGETGSDIEMSGIFDPQGHVFKIVMITASVVACFMFLCGLGWDFRRRRNKIGRKPETNGRELTTIEKELMADLNALFTKWGERLSETGGPFELQDKT